MSIHINKDTLTFTIHTLYSAYQMQVDKFGYLLHLYYGRNIGSSDIVSWPLVYADRGFSVNPYDAGRDRTYSLDYLPQEYPVQGDGDFRSPALILRDEEGTFGSELIYDGFEISKGKYGLKGLPAVYAADDESETLIIHLVNKRLGVRVSLYYGVLPQLDIITRAAVISNEGGSEIRVERLRTASLDLPAGRYDLHTFHGRHCMERQRERQPLGHCSLSVGSRRGMSSHQYNPFVMLSDPDTSEISGRCWVMEFVYSGGFAAEAERDQYDQVRMQMGLSEDRFSYPLHPGESLTAPEVIMTYSSDGFEKITHNLHRCIRGHICRGKYRDSARPVLLNSWEASYFGFDGVSLLELAKQAKELDMEMLVVDDGWFGNRFDDNRALGDWTPNEAKLGGSLADLVARVNNMGLRFGIWMEPEMISEDSDLYRAHPDWALAVPGKKPAKGRNQLVLDMSRADVREYVFNAVSGVLDCGGIEYLKWDYNSCITDVYSHGADDQGRVLYDYMIGLYDVLERLCHKYPDVLIEGCSGGGGRFDAGMLYYTPQIWCSDNTDAVDRLFIQYGTSFGYPGSAVGSHVSACPNHQTGRVTPLSTRGTVAMSGMFGYELDPSKMSDEEKNEVREQIRRFHAVRDLVRTGDYYRLSDPFEDDTAAWAYVAEDGSQALISAVIIQNHGNMHDHYVRVRGLTRGAMYRDMLTGRIYSSDALTDIGMPLARPRGDAESSVFHLERIQNA